MTYKRIATYTPDSKEQIKAIVIDTGDQILTINREDLSQLDTARKIKTALEARAGRELPDIFAHINRDGTIAIATGEPPEIWPEDEPVDEVAT